MMKLVALLFFFFLEIPAFSGENVFTTPNAFIPKDFEILDEYSSDLNQDGINDKILVLADKRENLPRTAEDSPRRPLLILFGTKNGYVKAAETKNLVYCKTCGGMMGDPYVGIVIKPPFFTVEHYGGSAWRWKQYVTFKYVRKNNTFVLHKLGDESFHAPDVDNGKTTIKTEKDFGLVKIQDFDNYRD